MDEWGTIIACIAIGLVVAVVSVIVGAKEQEKWNAFASQHQCKVVGKKAAESVTTYSPKGGMAFGSTSAQTGYACNDGVTYWRND